MSKRAIACVSMVAVLGILCFLAFRENSNIDDYRAEISELSQAFQAKDNSKVSELLERRSMSGRYGDIEDATKAYLTDIIKNNTRLTELRDNEELYTILDGDSLANDDEQLTRSRAKIAELRETADEIISEHDKLSEKSDMESYLKNDSEESKNLLNNTVNEIMEDGKLSESFTQQKALVSSTIDIYAEALDFLANHTDGWKVKNNRISFTDSKTKEKYLAILDKVSDIHSELSN